MRIQVRWVCGFRGCVDIGVGGARNFGLYMEGGFGFGGEGFCIWGTSQVAGI